MTSSQPAAQFPMSIAYTVADMRKTIAFYRDRLGFQLKESWPDDQNPMWANLVLDGQSVMIGPAMQPEQVAQFCAKEPAEAKFWTEKATTYRTTASRGVGVNVYVMVPDVDAFAASVQERGVRLDLQPKSQFYGLRSCVLTDPDGYCLTFYTPIKLETCQSCGMPLADAFPGQMYCAYCTDESGKLRPYEQVFAGTVQGYFVECLKLPRNEAEKAAKEHLAKMPAWAARG
jgi:catechol 2,3-dioxygenase-like lactoylglutathione lyase family enzyme